jgi:DNA-binding protein HU-beta
MNKQELISSISTETGLSKKDSAAALDAVTNAIADSLAKGEPVRLLGFGTFDVKSRAARTGKNPRTGESISIAASKMPSFKAGKELKDQVAGK